MGIEGGRAAAMVMSGAMVTALQRRRLRRRRSWCDVVVVSEVVVVVGSVGGDGDGGVGVARGASGSGLRQTRRDGREQSWRWARSLRCGQCVSGNFLSSHVPGTSARAVLRDMHNECIKAAYARGLR